VSRRTWPGAQSGRPDPLGFEDTGAPHHTPVRPVGRRPSRAPAPDAGDDGDGDAGASGAVPSAPGPTDADDEGEKRAPGAAGAGAPGIAAGGPATPGSAATTSGAWVGWGDRVDAELERVRAAGRWRQPRDLAVADAVRGAVADAGGERQVVSFASNDYLGLTHHPAVVAAAHEALDRWGTGTGASRLVVGSRPLHGELEAELAAWKGADDAVLFPTGYHANLGLLATLGGRDVTVLSDELNHASIVDGCRLARSAVRVFRHGDLDHVDALLADTEGPALVVTDSAFSMDGDVADVAGLAAVCSWYGALLVLDEAHGVLGPEVATRPADARPLDAPVLRMGTLSKALGSLGGFVAGSRRYVDLLRNRARSFIFTTASTPADTAAGLAALRVVRSDEGEALSARLRRHVDRLRPGHPTPIVPLVIGAETDALAAAAALLERGLLVPAIRPPTVPPGTSRLRVALSAAHSDAQVDRLVDALAELGLAGAARGGPAVGVPADVVDDRGSGPSPTSSWSRAGRRPAGGARGGVRAT
jgi:8-amino-7-oxononanoate synthase